MTDGGRHKCTCAGCAGRASERPGGKTCVAVGHSGLPFFTSSPLPPPPPPPPRYPPTQAAAARHSTCQPASQSLADGLRHGRIGRVEWTWTRGKGRADPMGLHGHYLPTILPTYRDRRRRRQRGREDQPTRWSSSAAARNMDGPFLSLNCTHIQPRREGGKNQLFLGEKRWATGETQQHKAHCLTNRCRSRS